MAKKSEQKSLPPHAPTRAGEVECDINHPSRKRGRDRLVAFAKKHPTLTDLRKQLGLA